MSTRARGVALVITLVMLAVVTFMAITFLAVSRRERSAVNITEEQTRARLMSESAIVRAQAEIVSQVLFSGNRLAYGAMVSTNFINPDGFDASLPAVAFNATNVNYDYRRGGGALTPDQRLRNIANLQYDPRPPVYVSTNSDPARPLDFRFYLDLNRNGRFESNGLLPVLGPRGQFLNTNGLPWRSGEVVLSNYFQGDPEWFGVLTRPGQPHAADNRFVGRMAYLVLPAGKSLDLNFMGNHALRLTDRELTADGYYRNQGVGAWELNLAAFLRDLNTNVTRNYTYFGLNRPSDSEAAEHALAFLRHRYADPATGGQPSLTNLASVRALYGDRGADAFGRDLIDGYTDGPAFTATNLLGLAVDNDLVPADKPWAGSDSPQAFFDFQEMVDPSRAPQLNEVRGGSSWRRRFLEAQTSSPATYDRYTFYRMLSQLGTDSSPRRQDKINLNYVNVGGLGATNFISWGDPDLAAGNPARGIPRFGLTGPELFFHQAADRLLRAARWTNIYDLGGGNFATNYYIGDTLVQPDVFVNGRLVQPGMSLTNIRLYPYREYSPAVHRLLQLAVNLHDATTNRALTPYPHLPTVLRPLIAWRDTNICIVGYQEVTQASEVERDLKFNEILDLSLAADRAKIPKGQVVSNKIVFDVPFIVGAKKGFPNFNEFSLQNVAQITRRLEVVKTRAGTNVPPSSTNQLYTFTVTNQFGIEFWNSYTQAFPRTLRLRLLGQVEAALNYGTNDPPIRTLNGVFTNRYDFNADVPANTWRGTNFSVPVLRGLQLAVNGVYQPNHQPKLVFPGTNYSDLFPGFQSLGFYSLTNVTLRTTNRMVAALIDVQANRVVDFVTFGSMRTELDISRSIFGHQQQLGNAAVGFEPASLWDTNKLAGRVGLNVPTMGALAQMNVALGTVTVTPNVWSSYSQLTAEGRDKDKSIDKLRLFCGLEPVTYVEEAQKNRLLAELRGVTRMQVPFSPTRKMSQLARWQANDPLVHYLAQDLLDVGSSPDDPARASRVDFVVPPTLPLSTNNLGRLNERYSPWGGNPNQQGDAFARDARLKDPGITQSDDWEFPTNKFPNLGWIGRVHRGTPWQTFYLKSYRDRLNPNPAVDQISNRQTNDWYRWSGSRGTHPTNDWLLLEAFTTAPNDNAARGLLGVNQSNLAAWSAVLSGVSVLSNITPANVVLRGTNRPEYVEYRIQPDAPDTNPDPTKRYHPQLRRIVDGINRTRENEVIANRQSVPVFNRLGRILATPELTMQSPFLDLNKQLTDPALERIPQQILSLLREDEPRFVVYAFGQSLREAPNSIHLQAGAFNRLCTNYQVTAEHAVKAVIRLDGPATSPRAIVESIEELTQ